jgi:hypothetical protein
MMYAVEMGSGDMTFIPSFIKTGSIGHTLIGGYTDTQSAWRLHKPALRE